MRCRSVSILALVLAVSTACNTATATPAPTVAPIGVTLAKSAVARASAPPEDAGVAATSINAFGFDLFRRTAGSGGNLVISPASISIALAMARAGALGTTAAQMDKLLRGVGSAEQASAINALDRALTGRSGSFPDSQGNSQDVTLRIANGQFAQAGLTFQPAFLDALAARFGAGVRLVDYKQRTEAARLLINGWVSDQTEKRIPELLGQGVLTPATRLTLVNAIYLKAQWQVPFFVEQTKPAPFTRADGTTVAVPTMNQLHARPYASKEGWQAVELPYVGEGLAMTIVVPDNLATFDASLEGDTFRAITDALTPTDVNLSLPRFGTKTSLDLAAQLAAMGMPAAFDPSKADFSGMTTEEQLFISAVVHQANITVDEKGTEAAAATAVVVDTTSAPEQPVTMKVDRPFFFALRDVPTGAIVFLGRIGDPSVGS
jgi:serpin B